MADIRWSAVEAVETILSTELNSLGNGSRKLSAAIDNDTASTERFTHGDFELSLGTQTTRTGSPSVTMYILPTVDGGTTYPTGSDSITPSSELIAGVFSFPLDATAHIAYLRNVVLPPSDFKVLLLNGTSQAFNASGNTLRMSKYGLESV